MTKTDDLWGKIKVARTLNPMIFTEPVKLETRTISIENLSSSLSGKVIVQLSDLHYDGLRLS